MGFLRDLIDLLKLNIRNLFFFELFYKLVSTTVLLPLFTSLFRVSIRLAGVEYVTPSNFFRYLFHPVSIIFLVASAFLLTAAAMIDIGAILYVVEASKQNKKVRLTAVFRFSMKSALRTFRRGNFMLMLMVLLMLPYMNIGSATGLFTYISVPEFAESYVTSHLWLFILCIIGLLLLFWVILKWLFCFHYFILEDCDFVEARKRSVELHKGKMLKSYFTLLLNQAGFFLLFVGVTTLLVLIVFGLSKLINAQSFLYSVVLGPSVVVITILFLLFMCMSVPVTFFVISVLFYRHKERIGEPVHHLEIPDSDLTPRKGPNPLAIVIIIGSAIGMIFYCYGIMNHKINFNVENMHNIDVTAHRGCRNEAPENTMSAFTLAANKGAQWIELDVQITKDEIPVVLHDSNLKRVTGNDVSIWEVTYEEIKDWDCGSWFSEEFAGERISPLSEVLRFAKRRDINLIIELKPNGHEPEGYEQLVVDEIKKARMQSQCAVSSLLYGTLEKVKACDPGITTLFNITMAFGNIEKNDCADILCVETSFVSRRMVEDAHNAGKPIFVWTVNSWTNLDRMVQYGVDNIVTDEIERAQTVINRSRVTTRLEQYIRKLADLFGFRVDVPSL